MKERKFRAWDEGNKVMHQSFQWMSSGTDGNDWVVFISDLQPIYNDAIKNPFFSQQLKKMQFTGLKDKNEKEIYEGDIVVVSGAKHVVSFYIHAFVFADETGVVKIFNLPSPNFIEIIGNIYEHPELIHS